MKTERYIGLMSGTSLDGIDAVLVEFRKRRCTLLQAKTDSYPEPLRAQLIALIDAPDRIKLDDLGTMHAQLALAYAEAVRQLIASAGIGPQDIKAVGCHGQTVRHAPDAQPPFSLQLGDASRLANETGIATVADFRSADIALGGQGAPLVPAFHDWMFADADEARAVVNIGGIANITLLQPGLSPTGYDVGPGNTLIDGWAVRHLGRTYDDQGSWAASGQVHRELLKLLQSDPYFTRPAPKSTGREMFNLDWLDASIARLDQAPAAEDVQTTLVELSVGQIAHAVHAATPAAGTVAVCGGGAFNDYLMSRLQQALPDCDVKSTAAWGLAPEWVEAVAFAWLARQRLAGKPAGLPSVTGATRAALLGAIYLPAP
jgi:anhydro-N-acetylmuramic acid kinase